MFQVEVPSCKRFATDRGEVVSETIWSDFESIILHKICLKMEDIHSILKMYDDIVHYSNTPYCVFALPPNVIFRRTSAQISSKMRTM